eukprot:CAMPEP_0171295292 /NCGR_PEP_ID=MMETSP0816-20121228/3886_1 /TAXON_ID=420281 /ORGANISM="Proboscia inermis, Strain CCAP1064/1" /LENGTH=280 /DNA_ID=CAMNT_0011767841 /DNA_START=342 /DNA_END=1181 /DNA_ORIENTATION=+
MTSKRSKTDKPLIRIMNCNQCLTLSPLNNTHLTSGKQFQTHKCLQIIADIDPIHGIKHTVAIANFIADGVANTETFVFASPFQRTTQTACAIADAINVTNSTYYNNNREKVIVRIEEGLMEWLTPALVVTKSSNTRTYPKTTAELSQLFPGKIDPLYKSLNPPATKDSTSPKFPETEAALLLRANTTLTRLVKDSNLVSPSSSSTKRNIVIVSHAPCDQALAFALEGAKSPADSQLSYWPLGGITKFTSKVSSGSNDWVLDFYGRTHHMPGEYKDGLKEW